MISEIFAKAFVTLGTAQETAGFIQESNFSAYTCKNSIETYPGQRATQIFIL